MKYKILVSGKNINKFVKRLNTNEIDLYNINIINSEEMEIVIDVSNYEKVLKLKTIYTVTIIKEIGLISILNKIKKYRYIVISFILSAIILFILSNIIFNIKVIHTDSKLINEITNELKKYGIDTYKIIPSREKLTKIEESILKDNKDSLEWISISSSGTYIEVKLEERILNDTKENDNYIEIIAKKSGIIKDIIAASGEKIVDENTYVKKGDVIISSSIKVNDVVKDVVSASGNVYAEVWYTVHVTYPLHIKSREVTNNKTNVLSFNFITNRFNLFKKNNYKYFNIDEKKLVQNPLLPIYISYDTVYEVNSVDERLTVDEATKRASEVATKKLSETLKNDEKILSQKTLKKTQSNSIIELDIFFKVYENISEEKILSDDELKAKLNKPTEIIE